MVNVQKPSETKRYISGDVIVKTIFLNFKDADNEHHIGNRIIVLNKLFSTHLSNKGIETIVKFLCEKHNDLAQINNKSIEEISNLVDEISNHHKGHNKKHCFSFVTKYLFWHVYAMQNQTIDGENYNDKFFIFDNIVADEIKFRKHNGAGFYKRWYDACMKRQKNDHKLTKLNNRDFDLRFWNAGKAK